MTILHFSTSVSAHASARSSKYLKNSKSSDISPLNVRALLEVGAGMPFMPFVLALDIGAGGAGGGFVGGGGGGGRVVGGGGNNVGRAGGCGTCGNDGVVCRAGARRRVDDWG